MWRKSRRRKYLSAVIPEEFGGLGADMITYGLLNEEIGRACSSTRSLLAVQGMVSYALLRWGKPQHKQTWLPRLLEANASSFARADQRLAQDFTPTYADLQTQLRQNPVAHVDETGWKVGGHSAWLWVCTNDQLTVYAIDPHRDHTVVERMLGQNFAGVLITDCFLAYDPLTYEKSKCVGHLLRRCNTLVESGNASAIRFSEHAARLLRSAIKLKERQPTMNKPGYAVACGRLEAVFDRLLARHYRQAKTVRFVKLLRKQRPYLFTFLYVAAVAPTNNAAERELRPAVIIRKTNGCNRSSTGATVHAVLSSVIRTARKHGHDVVEVAKRVLQHPEPVIANICSPAQPPPISPVPTAHSSLSAVLTT